MRLLILSSFLERNEWMNESFFNQCHRCGKYWISTDIMYCPFCESGDIKNVPFRDHPLFSYHWLEGHGFPYVEELIKK